MANGPMNLMSKEEIRLIASNLTIAYYAPNKLPDGHITEEKVFGVYNYFIKLLTEEKAAVKASKPSVQSMGKISIKK